MKENVIRDKSFSLAKNVLQLISKLPANSQGFVLSNQLGRAGTSVGANVEEAIAAFSKADFRHKMSIALKEARETNYWLRLIHETQLIQTENLHSTISESEEVMRILGAIVKSSSPNN
ncbi:MAG: four helix bundle protein [Calditrichaeota bacterium]|nr:MAG: four helix bundle protein [Calditrichota bacterium]